MQPGKSYPLGATLQPDGVNFSLYSKDATGVDLLLFDQVDAREPARTIALAPRLNRTYDYWHIFLPDIRPGQLYGYRVHGPFEPQNGLRFDPSKILLDPYGRGVAVPEHYSREAATLPGDNTPFAMKSVVADLSAYDWEDDRPLKRPFTQTIIYEMHVGGFTKHPNSGVEATKRGTYAGLIEKIPYLQDLGVTAVELLPVFQFDEQEAPPGLTNYWGYNPVAFFAPHIGYCTRQDPLTAIDEFRDMVKALHRAEIEVILDVVFNHTAEGNEDGPTFCFKGLGNDIYYMLEANKSRYTDYSGTGNTLNANDAMVRRLILDSLHFWMEQMHVDGFRFDLASILARDESGQVLANPPVLWDIETDPVLAGAKLIAEAWDAAGLYQVGSFIGDHWKEWNGRFRDDVRAFFRGDSGFVSTIAARFLASPDIYGHENREPEQSINFVTCHDGFTMNDLVSYNRKHNEANKEDNRDGMDNNLSWNCGVEGPTDDPEIERLRNRQMKNFFTITLLALGVPMLLMGDEVRRTQRGNNNAYCQDNEISWFDWSLLERHADMHRFAKDLIRFRLSMPSHQQDRQLSLIEFLRQSKIEWHGVKVYQPDWSYPSHSIALTVQGEADLFYLILNAYWEPLSFQIPPHPAGTDGIWRCILDTALAPPADFSDPTPGDPADAPIVSGPDYTAQPRSVVVLIAERIGQQD